MSQRTSMRRFLLLLLCFGWVSLTLAQSEKAPKYSNEFLNIGVGARALGMSNAVVASTQDVTAGYWNPTGLLGVQSDLQFGLMHSEYFAGIAKYDYLGGAKRIDENSAFALSAVRFGVDNIPNTTELIDNQGNIDYDRVSYFSAADLGLVFSYARKINDKFSVGGNAKLIHRKVGDFASSWGFGIDASASYQTEKWKFAAVARDVTSTFNAWNYTLSDRTIEVFLNTGNEIPENGLEVTLPRLILGAARQFDLAENYTLLVEVNTDFTTDGRRNTLISGDPFSIDPHMGVEFGIFDMVYVRSGIGNIQKVSQLNGRQVFSVQPNIGVGIKIKGIQLDYALSDIGDASVALYSNVFSLRFNLNPPERE